MALYSAPGIHKGQDDWTRSAENRSDLGFSFSAPPDASKIDRRLTMKMAKVQSSCSCRGFQAETISMENSSLSDLIDLQLPSISRVVDLQHSDQILSRFNSGEKELKKKKKKTSTVNLTRRTGEHLRVHGSEVFKVTWKGTEEWRVPLV